MRVESVTEKGCGDGADGPVGTCRGHILFTGGWGGWVLRRELRWHRGCGVAVAVGVSIVLQVENLFRKFSGETRG